MAYAALLSLAQTIGKVLLNHNQYSISDHNKQQIRSIYGVVIFLQEFLEDSPEKANSLERRIRDIAMEAEEIIEYFMLERIRVRLIEWTVLPAKFKFKYQLTKIRGKIDSVMGKVMEMKNNSSTIKDAVQLSDSPAASSSSRSVAHTGKTNDMVGLDDDLMAMKSQLCGESLKLQVIPIVGMGGIGKTTLARNAYNDSLIVETFHIRAWVTVSQDYSVQELFSGLLISMNLFNEEIDGQSSDEMAEKVYKSLKGRRYLVVMDDMWSRQVWDDVRNVFPDDGNGSRIMLTTRLSDVAAYPDTCSRLHTMRLMDDGQSWNLLRQKVFIHQDCPPELKNIGQKIARNCRGLPLAIVVIAGLLSTVSKNPASWEEIAKNVNPAVTAENGRFEEILSLSYTHLPHYLRPCLLYMGIFPEDHEIRVSRLIKLWVAEGFLKRPYGSKSFEEEAEECLEDLIMRNLVLVTQRKSNGKIKSCSLHDLMRDLCIRKAHEEKFLVNIRGGYIRKFLSMKSRMNQHRISIAPSGLPYLSKIYGSTIHTIVCFAGISLMDSSENFRLLRVLDAGDAYVRSLPAQLFELVHLRYLAIYYLDMIPAAISKLQNLLTLSVRARNEWRLFRTHSHCLPQEIWGMPQLRHLVCYGWLPDPEGTTSTLENLQTLSLVSHYMCTERIMRMIPNLKELEIDCSDFRQGKTCLNNLVYLHRLENLKLRSVFSNTFCQKENFAFPRLLKKLTLSRLPLPWNEMTIVGSLPNLQALKLTHEACKGSTWETTEGEFLQLEFLLIEKSDLEHWVTESSHFPRLKCLVLDECRQLSEIPDGIGEISTLELIEVKGKAKKSLVESAKRIQEEQQDWGNDVLQVRCMTC